ncbi:hypothetical protein BX616_004075 [Lobosporangium transversale]|uniref:Uncharacterized protein n=1 Tax=Lobosporangium transversale TaxID=64571 RepID=A0A1Y2G878_9FUNG|nr:hypothetical protein BCR41DRAFT_375075 [Lobosporangium transversale]KAF9898407.1 hypothetical protein BX616_004075 [Lobosporangium transversale]ORZ04066.1 hypothetical protein BCR41DRAFT_375075 [Lobosporangium transversale]|eukprot:XP_021876343.1 hypothetical protein BCR41DRAFT_375075 [Lobosporangium transversale]
MLALQSAPLHLRDQINSISSSASTSRHQQHQALFYRECDLKQDLSVTNAKIIMHHNLTNNIINTSSSSPSSGSSNHSKNSIQFDPTYNNLPSAPLTPIQNCTGPYEESSPLQTPIKKINDRIDQMSIEDCSKEKIVLILTAMTLYYDVYSLVG